MPLLRTDDRLVATAPCTHTLQGSAGYVAASALCDRMRELELTLPGKAPASNPHSDAQEAEGIRGLRKVCIY
jgi:hypothetical protein